jgi:hydroxyacylglutathione hydrolase
MIYVVDPGDAEPVIKYLEKNKLNLDRILITHHHWDHINGVLELKQKYKPKVYGPSKEKFNYIDIDVLDENNRFIDKEIKVFPTPGHTLDHCIYWVKQLNKLFVGDFIFAMGCGRLFEGSYQQLLQSLSILNNFSNDTLIYCAHEYTMINLRFTLSIDPSNQNLLLRKKDLENKVQLGQPTIPFTLFEERLTNPFLRLENHSIRNHFSTHTDLQTLTALRKLRNQF